MPIILSVLLLRTHYNAVISRIVYWFVDVDFQLVAKKASVSGVCVCACVHMFVCDVHVCTM